MRRLFSVDILRATAILLMVQVHFVGNLSPREPSSRILYDLSDFLGGFAAPIFTFLVGLNLWLWLNKQLTIGTDETALGKFVNKRGILIVLFGLIFAVIIWAPNEIFNWDILPMIGIATMIVYALCRAPSKYLIGLALLLLLSAPTLRELTNYSSHWIHDQYTYNFTLSDIFLGATLQGYFPLLPWLVFPLMGFCLGRDIFQGEQINPKAARRLPILGVVLIAISAVGALVSEYFPIGLSWYLSPYSFYPASTTYILGMLGFILLVFWILWQRFDLREGKDRSKHHQIPPGPPSFRDWIGHRLIAEQKNHHKTNAAEKLLISCADHRWNAHLSTALQNCARPPTEPGNKQTKDRKDIRSDPRA